MPRHKTDGKRNTNRLPLPDSIPAGTRAVTVCIPDGDEYFMYLVGAMYRLGQQIWYDRDEAKTAQHVAQVWRNALAKTLAGECASPTEPEPDRPKLEDIIAGGYATMCNHSISKFNGKWYIGLDCGCGNITWIPLGEAVELNPTTNAPVTPEQNPASITAPSTANQSCYATASVDYLLTRFRQWLNFTLGTVTTGLDEAFNVFDDVVSIAAQFFSKSDERSLWDALIEAGEEELYSQVAVYRQAYIENFALSGKIAADDIKKLFTDEIGIWTLAGQSVILWLATSKLLGITGDLAKLAADCEANRGTSQLAQLLPSPPIVPTVIGEYEGTTAIFEILQFEIGSLSIGDTWTHYSQITNMVGFGIEFYPSGTGGFGSSVIVDALTGQDVFFNDAYDAQPGTLHKWARIVGAETQQALESVWVALGYKGDTTFYDITAAPGLRLTSANNADVTGIQQVKVYIVRYDLK